MIVSRNLNIWRRSREYYPRISALYDKVFGRCTALDNDKEKCPACCRKFKEDCIKVEFKIKRYNGEKIYTAVCEDCNQDRLDKHK